MKIEVTDKRENPLQERTELHFVIDHSGEATPARKSVITALAKAVKADEDKIVIESIESQYGKNKSVAYAKVYDSVESATRLERKHLLVRSGVGAQPQPEEE